MKARGPGLFRLSKHVVQSFLVIIFPSTAFCDDGLDAVNRTVTELFRAGRYVDGLQSAQTAVGLAEKIRGANHPDVATALYNLADFYTRLNKPSEAEVVLRRALSIDEAAGNERHVARDLNKLGYLLQAAHRFKEAKAFYARAFTIDVRLFGPTHRNVARDLNNMALLLNNEGKPAEAESFQTRAVEILRGDPEAGPEPNNDLTAAMANLADIYRQTQRAEAAELLYREILEAQERSLGVDHPRVGVFSNNLAEVLRTTGKHAESEQLYRRAISIETARTGPAHPNVATYMNNLANLLRETHREEEAAEILQKALAIDEASMGEFSAATARDLKNTADLMRTWKGASEAIPLMRRVVAILEREEFSSPPTLGPALCALGDLLSETQQFAEAEQHYRRAVELDTESYGPRSERVIYDLNRLAAVLKATNRASESNSVLQHIEEIARSSKYRSPPPIAMSP